MKKQAKVVTDLTGQIIENTGYWRSRLLIGTPVTGLVRIEWAMGRWGQTIPTNWSQQELRPWIASVAPLRFLVADAQNIIVQKAIELDVEWLVLVEQDNVLPPDCFLRLNEYMIESKIPVVSGLYFTKSVPPEPMIYRGAGNGHYDKWKMGDLVWATGVPTGTILINMSIIKEMYKDSPEYSAGGMKVRRVFDAPAKVWFDEKTGMMRSESGTSDLMWCRRVIEGKYFEKAGWKKYQEMENPFLVDTRIFVRHIDDTGRMYPLTVPKKFEPEVKKDAVRNKRTRKHKSSR